jgi:hypothetical protein
MNQSFQVTPGDIVAGTSPYRLGGAFVRDGDRQQNEGDLMRACMEDRKGVFGSEAWQSVVAHNDIPRLLAEGLCERLQAVDPQGIDADSGAGQVAKHPLGVVG